MKSLDINRDPFFATSVYINVATTLKRACVHYHTTKYATPYLIFGNEHCDAEEVANSVVTFLEAKFEVNRLRIVNLIM